MSEAGVARRTRRVLRLLRMLQQGGHRVDHIAAELGVSRRTVFRDLRVLERMGVRYRYDPHQQGYAIQTSPFLPALNLSLEEALALMLVFRRMVKRGNTPGYAPLMQAAAKIEALLPEELTEHCGRLLDGVEFRWPATSHATGQDYWFQMIQQSMASRKPLRMRYRSLYERGRIETVLSPHRLVFVSRGWYVFGHSSMHHEQRTFKLGRIERLKCCSEPFVARSGRTGRRAAAWSLIPEGQVYQVKLRFSPKVAANVAEVLWHPGQVITPQQDGSALFEVQVDGIREISWWILGYGAEVEVLEPEELREAVIQAAVRMVDLYNGGDPVPRRTHAAAANRRRRRPADPTQDRQSPASGATP